MRAQFLLYRPQKGFRTARGGPFRSGSATLTGYSYSLGWLFMKAFSPDGLNDTGDAH